MEYIVGTDASLTFTFERSGEPVIPDVGSVMYTVMDHSGSAISGLTNVAVTTTTDTWQIHIVVPAVNNTIDVLKKFERRSIRISYNINGKFYSRVVQYRIVPFYNYSVAPKDVRSFIGLQEKELMDEDIDLVSAYLYVENMLTGADVLIAPLLSSGTTQEIAANNAIKAKAVLDVLPSVKQRMAQEETNGVTGFKRATIKDFAEIERKALDLLSGAFTEMIDPVEDALTLVLVTEDADPITG